MDDTKGEDEKNSVKLQKKRKWEGKKKIKESANLIDFLAGEAEDKI